MKSLSESAVKCALNGCENFELHLNLRNRIWVFVVEQYAYIHVHCTHLQLECRPTVNFSTQNMGSCLKCCNSASPE